MIINAVKVKGPHLFTAGWDGRVKKWDIETGKELANVELGKYVNTIVFSTEEEDMVYGGGKDGYVWKIKI